MAASSTISSKGQITVPIEVRRRLGVKQGDRVEFVVEGGKTILRAVQPAENPFDKYIGAPTLQEPGRDQRLGPRDARSGQRI